MESNKGVLLLDARVQEGYEELTRLTVDEKEYAIFMPSDINIADEGAQIFDLYKPQILLVKKDVDGKDKFYLPTTSEFSSVMASMTNLKEETGLIAKKSKKADWKILCLLGIFACSVALGSLTNLFHKEILLNATNQTLLAANEENQRAWSTIAGLEQTVSELENNLYSMFERDSEGRYICNSINELNIFIDTTEYTIEDVFEAANSNETLSPEEKEFIKDFAKKVQAVHPEQNWWIFIQNVKRMEIKYFEQNGPAIGLFYGNSGEVRLVDRLNNITFSHELIHAMTSIGINLDDLSVRIYTYSCIEEALTSGFNSQLDDYINYSYGDILLHLQPFIDHYGINVFKPFLNGNPKEFSNVCAEDFEYAPELISLVEKIYGETDWENNPPRYEDYARMNELSFRLFLDNWKLKLYARENDDIFAEYARDVDLTINRLILNEERLCWRNSYSLSTNNFRKTFKALEIEILGGYKAEIETAKEEYQGTLESRVSYQAGYREGEFRVRTVSVARKVDDDEYYAVNEFNANYVSVVVNVDGQIGLVYNGDLEKDKMYEILSGTFIENNDLNMFIPLKDYLRFFVEEDQEYGWIENSNIFDESSLDRYLGRSPGASLDLTVD